MFDNPRFLTPGVQIEIPLALQFALWQLIDTMPVEKDCLQVFRLERVMRNDRSIQKISHSQEIPPYKKEYLLALDKPLTLKIFVIDDGEHSTMMLCDEY